MYTTNSMLFVASISITSAAAFNEDSQLLRETLEACPELFQALKCKSRCYQGGGRMIPGIGRLSQYKLHETLNLAIVLQGLLRVPRPIRVIIPVVCPDQSDILSSDHSDLVPLKAASVKES